MRAWQTLTSMLFFKPIATYHLLTAWLHLISWLTLFNRITHNYRQIIWFENWRFFLFFFLGIIFPLPNIQDFMISFWKWFIKKHKLYISQTNRWNINKVSLLLQIVSFLGTKRGWIASLQNQTVLRLQDKAF